MSEADKQTNASRFSDFVVYADESGTASLAGVDPDYPVFVLAFVVIPKNDYVQTIVPALQRLKFDFFGHDQIVLHEHELRRQEKDFAFLRTDKALREGFLNRVNELVRDMNATVIAAAIDKNEHGRRYTNPWDCYHVALRFCLERVATYLAKQGQKGRIHHIVFESRGAKEDSELELEFRRIASGEADWGYIRTDFASSNWRAVFANKQTNSAGLQLADLFARPIGLHMIRPNQRNRAYEIIETKLWQGDYKRFP